MKNLILISTALALMIAVGATFASKVVDKSKQRQATFTESRAEGITGLITNQIIQAIDLSSIDEISIPGNGNFRVMVDPSCEPTMILTDLANKGSDYRVTGNELVLFHGLSDLFSEKNEYDILINDLKRIKVLGGGSIEIITLLSGDHLSFEMAGTGSIEAKVDTDKLDVIIYGSGDIELNGKAEELSLKVVGSGDFIAKNLNGEHLNASILGSGDSEVGEFKDMEVMIAGSGDLAYRGQPVIDGRSPGSGRLVAVE